MQTKDPMGAAIADYWKNGVAGRLRVFSPEFDEDEIPVDTLFRQYDEMPAIEQKALQMACGNILDVGAGSGCHALALQDKGKSITAIDISQLSVDVMKEEGVKHVVCEDFYNMEGAYDTLLFLMNGSGIIGTIDNMDRFFAQADKLLKEGGQILMDSSDIRYVFEDEDGVLDINLNDGYYGEMIYQMQYKRIKGDTFPWLYIDFATLQYYAEEHGFTAELVEEGEHYDYLARIVKT